MVKTLFSLHEASYAYQAPPTKRLWDSHPVIGEGSCGLDIWIGNTVENAKGIVLLTQNPEEPRSLGEDVCAIASQVTIQEIWAAIGPVHPISLRWLEYYPPDRVNVYGRLEEVCFRQSIVGYNEQVCHLFNPFWLRTTVEMIEAKMGMGWKEMGLPEMKRWVG